MLPLAFSFTDMRSFLVTLVVLNLGTITFAQQRARITLLSTTDLHGNIFPIDYYRNQPAQLGLAKVATLIHEARKDAPDALLLDCGDTIQGTPLAYYHNRVNNTPPDPMMLAMNHLRFDALAVGNHEFNFGLAVFEKARREARFPWLGANILSEKTGEPAYDPVLVKEIQGVRVCIVGVTTPGIPSWENAVNYAGLRFADPIATTRRWVRVLRDEHRADVVVVAMHMGLEEDLTTGVRSPGQVPNENAALAVARQVEGIDVILMGHTHREVPALMVNGALLAQANRWGDRLIRADLFLERADSNQPWTILARRSVSIPVHAGTPADSAILALAQPYHDATQAWLSRPIGYSAEALSAEQARVQDTAIIDVIQRVQLDYGKADISFAAAFSPQAALPKGDVTVRDISGLYIYENTLVVLELTGRQVRDALEHAARYFRPYQPGKTPTELIDPTIPGYNFDMAEGVEYTIDLRQAPGSRITRLDFRGAPVQPDQRFRVATNNYRMNGGGGYDMFRGAPVLDRSSREIRDLIVEWVEKHREVPTVPNRNWKIITE